MLARFGLYSRSTVVGRPSRQVNLVVVYSLHIVNLIANPLFDGFFAVSCPVCVSAERFA